MVRRVALLLLVAAFGCGADVSSMPLLVAERASRAPAVAREASHDEEAPFAIEWQTGDAIGRGVTFADTGNEGTGAFVGYAGYRVTREAARAWVTALYRATLRERGIRYLWAVRGPEDVQYARRDIGNSHVARALVRLAGGDITRVVVAAHSSGSFVAHELLAQLSGGLDPEARTAGKVVYFDLDGASRGLTTAATAWLARAFFVGARDDSIATGSPNDGDMRSAAATFGAVGAYYRHDAHASGCGAGARWCVHDTPITTRPHDSGGASSALDYADFDGRDVAHAWFDANASASGL